MSDKIHHYYTDEAVCPYCGHEHSHSHEWFEKDKDHATGTCEECGRDFSISRDFTVEYSTEKITT